LPGGDLRHYFLLNIMRQLPLIIAHRGDSRHAPENTLAAFRAAAEAGADCIELDVQMTLDGALVCMHDRSLERTTNARAVFPARDRYIVPDFTLDELRRLNAGAWFGSEFEGETIPTLGETIETVLALPARVGLLVEIKDAPLNGTRISTLLVELARLAYEYELAKLRASTGQFTVESFHPPTVMSMAEIAPGIRRLQLAPAFSKFIPSVFPHFQATVDSVRRYAHGIALPDAEATPDVVGTVHEAGLEVLVWTVNDVLRIRELAALGVQGIVTDDPAAARRELGDQAFQST
jgi:glycerophosphoryl diester phosphodiesterase